ncbi:ester cyclase [Saccharopolyspora sp. NPDC049426]|uniref:ester cyclase n=1 Tax=Saccharopolyspora sp. NPDC049426 TaxID=3155652 RepID=UPI0034321438
MSAAENAHLVHRFYKALEEGAYATVTDMVHDDFVFYGQIDTPRPGAEGFLAAEKRNVEAFAGISMTVERTVADDDQVGAYVIVEGDQTGEFNGIPPAGSHMRFSMFNLFTFQDGKIIEKRAHYNTLDIINQLKR